MTSPGYSFEVALNYSDSRVPRYNLRDVVHVARRACPCIFGHPAGVLVSGPDAHCIPEYGKHSVAFFDQDDGISFLLSLLYPVLA
jgi:hypothetical protein